jgi:hypothetical protein
MKIISIVGVNLLLIIFSFIAVSENVPVNKARTVAGNFFCEKATIGFEQIKFYDEYSIYEGVIPVYYVFNINEGFVIISAQDVVFPVLAYSFGSNFTNNGFPPAFSAWMKSYKSQIVIAATENPECPEINSKTWLKYSSENFVAKKNSTTVGPLILTNWSQGCFYNSQFPNDTTAPCGHLWTGCVATAMGQVMKYYNFPDSGTGSHGYNSSYGWVEADFGNTQYNWQGMNYNLVAENEAVAELLFHCAISINSQFFPEGTGAFDFSAAQALGQYFNYGPGVQFYWRDSYIGDWLAMLRTELDEGRPVIYGGADSETNSGHSLVCDGYQDTAFFHFNWGWNGTYNGYFYLDSLIAGSNYFDFQHDAVTGIKPNITGVIETFPPENVAASIDGKSVLLSWDPPAWPGTLELLGYNIFRDGMVVNPAIIITDNYLDIEVPAGDHDYFVKSVYIGGESVPTEVLPVYISGINDYSINYLDVFPIPASDYIVIPTGQFNTNQCQIYIYDVTGFLIFEKEYRFDKDEELKILLTDKSSGLFILKILTDTQTFSSKIIISQN